MAAFFDSVSKAVKGAIANQTALPTEIKCQGCKVLLGVPPTTFNWSCPQCQIFNPFEAKQCAKCNALKPAKQGPFVIECAACHAITEVPTSNFVKGSKEAWHATTAAVVGAAQATKAKVIHLSSAAETFNCTNCNAMLHNPNVGPNPVNPPVKEVMCAVCRKICPVPSINLVNDMRMAGNSIVRVSRKVFYSVSGAHCVNCPQCQNPCKIPKDNKPKDPNAPPQVVPAPQAVPAPAQPAPAPVPQPAPAPAPAPGLVPVPTGEPSPTGTMAAPMGQPVPSQMGLQVSQQCDKYDMTCEKCGFQFRAEVYS